MKNIDSRVLKKFERSFDEDPKNSLAMNAVTENGISSVALSRKDVDRINFTFSHQIESPEATNQERSGRCWLFSGLSFLALEAMKKLKVKTFELSEIYQMFWDKLEKANFFLENMIETREEPLYSRRLMWLLSDPLSDGGQWDMLVNLVKKYGVVPKSFMRETKSSNNSEPMNTLLETKLREYAKLIRDKHADNSHLEDLRSIKEKCLGEFYRMLVVSLGKPPTDFYWEWRDKDEKFHRHGRITPKEFYSRYIGVNLDDFVCLINAPTPDKPFNRVYTVKNLNNVIEGRPIRYLNVDMKSLKKITIEMIKDNHAVWFGSDVGQMLATELGAMDLSVYDYDLVFGTKFNLDKASRLEYGSSKMTHAMLLTGVDLDESARPTKWRVENSWGTKIGDKGFMYMMDEWFDQYLYEVTVNKKYLGPELLKALETELVPLEPWDPMGSLAMS
jgi:bleomycin hydrolase